MSLEKNKDYVNRLIFTYIRIIIVFANEHMINKTNFSTKKNMQMFSFNSDNDVYCHVCKTLMIGKKNTK